MAGTLVFDWDGTLHETAALYGAALRKACRWLTDAGYTARELSDTEAAVYLGMNALDMWASFMPELPEEIRLQASHIVGDEMLQAIKDGYARLYPGAESVLQSLHDSGYRMVILSNCSCSYMQAHRSYFRLDRWFDGYFCCEEYHYAPKTEIFLEIRQQYMDAFCMIGDRASDLAVAREHSLSFIGCAYGYGSLCELEGAGALAKSVEDIPRLLKL